MSIQDYNLLINGKGEGSNKRLDVRNPYNQKLIGTVPNASPEHIEKAIKSAYESFELMKTIPAHKRSLILERTANIIQERKEELAQTITSEAGKPIKLARGEVDRSIETFKFASEEAKRLYGETIPMDASQAGEGKMAFTIREPLGVIGAITPFNFPLNLVAHKVAPAIAAGNTIVLKPATYTPITAIKLGEIMLDAGLPDGALNILTGPGATVGNAIVGDPRIAKITFTGSASVGLEITKKIGIKRITLELGSNSPLIIDKNVALGAIMPRCIFGSFAYSGQVCISIQRIYLHKDIKADFLNLFLEKASKLKCGDPLDENTDIGPMITEQEAERVKQRIDEAISKGAKILIGGNRKGAMFEPTVLTNVSPDMKVVSQEIFAPVVTIMSFEDWTQVIKEVNLSNYGLNAGVYTNDVEKAIYAGKNLEVGGVIINDIPTFRVDHMPYGGVKGSGIGREGVKYAIQEMTQPKFICFSSLLTEALA